MKEKYDIIIAGSGISGMSLGYYAAKSGLNVLILEKNKYPGGSFTTENVDDYWIELGAHTMYNSYGNLIDIIEGCGLKGDIIKRKKVPYKAYRDGKIRSVVSQFSIFELLISLPSLFTIKKDNNTVESYYSRILGKRNYRKFFQYMFNAVPSQPTNDFPSYILFKKRQRRKDILKSFTFRNGTRSIIDAISTMPGIDILSETVVSEITRENSGFSVKTTNRNIFTCRYVGIATPVNSVATLLRETYPAVADKIKQIEFVKTDSVGVVLNKKDVDLKEIAGIVGIDSEFFSVVSRDVVEDDRYRGFVFHFKPDSYDNQYKTKFISKFLGIAEEKLLRTIFRQNIVPSFRLGHETVIRQIDDLLKQESIFITGNYFSGMAIEDCVTRSLSEFKRLLKKEELNT